MIAALGVLVFAGAFATSVTVMAREIAPQWRRIIQMASGVVETPFAPLSELTLAERRIAVRRWAAQPAPSPVAPWRAAA